ncbi:unnamed protein product [Penicillium salamii]|uniref:Uncharacterized protein n=1 Tax=Penicillium salamii TaxID=1612424 RepID=A0A9W4JUC1_9EURO|nr:unnamed protein product [Penicillium salamii]CAG8251176.1 unnamed protein product [Penicillium salamii]CAG8271831.1 unnamed protein product [Penicillium salamii]CAG8274043.1 unnamed protein product [Penicillium salamii]CAG8285563.1 unnamed protein product [Penicillium salamii]
MQMYSYQKGRGKEGERGEREVYLLYQSKQALSSHTGPLIVKITHTVSLIPQDISSDSLPVAKGSEFDSDLDPHEHKVCQIAE